MVERPARAAPRVLGITGPIGCGKSTVGDILLELGARERIDADAVVHELQAAGTEVTRAIARAFGEDVLAANGGVDRQRLAAIVFGDPARLAALEAIVHPAVRRVIRERVDDSQRDGVIVIDAVKLLQSDLLDLVEEVWVVQCTPGVQRARLIEIREMAPEAAEARLRAQPTFEHQRVTTVIDNSGSLDDLRRRTHVAWRQFFLIAGGVSRTDPAQ